MFITFLKDLHYAFIGIGLVDNCTVYGVLIEIFLNGHHLLFDR